MKIISEETLNEFRQAKTCEACGRELRQASEAAHIFSRGTGRLDIRINLCALGGPWECACHHHSHNQGRPSREELVSIAARREGFTASSLEATIYALRRADKSANAEDIMKEWLVKRVDNTRESSILDR